MKAAFELVFLLLLACLFTIESVCIGLEVQHKTLKPLALF